jgi:ABC-2 type transport system permease protein
VRAFVALIGAGFRRYSTYRQATLAGLATNTVFGFLNCYVLLAVAHARGGPVAGYSATQLVTLVWINQGLLASVGLWSDLGLADRIRSGDVVADLLRPIHPVVNYLGTDLGRAGSRCARRSWWRRWPGSGSTSPTCASATSSGSVCTCGPACSTAS